MGKQPLRPLGVGKGTGNEEPEVVEVKKARGTNNAFMKGDEEYDEQAMLKSRCAGWEAVEQDALHSALGGCPGLMDWQGMGDCWLYASIGGVLKQLLEP